MELDQVPHQREAEPEPAVASRRRPLRLAEALEDVRQEISRDAAPVVLDDDPAVSVVLVQREADFAAARAELHRIREEVPDDLLEAIRIADDLDHVRIDLADDGDVLGFGGWPGGLEGVAHDVAEIDRREVEAQLARDDPRHVEDVLDELDLDGGVALDDLEPTRVRRARDLGTPQHPRPAEDGVQRRPELVRDDRQELVLRTVRFLGLLARLALAALGVAHRLEEACRPEDREDARLELRRVERFADEVVGAGAEPVDELLGVIDRGQDEDGQRCLVERLADEAADLDPAHARHHPVEDQEIGPRAGGEALERARTVAEDLDPIPRLEGAARDLRLHGAVVDDPNLLGGLLVALHPDLVAHPRRIL